MTPSRWIVPVALLSGIAGAAAPAPAAAQRITAENVIVVTMDGLRWQEVFDGAALELINRAQGGLADSAALVKRFWRESAQERRAALLPFLWTTIAARGQIFGDSTRGSDARVTNGLRFSYPGYNELLTGAPDPRIASNDTVLNPNMTVLEWLNGLPRFRGRVAAFGSWEVLPYIVNARRSGIFVNGDGPPVADPRTERDRLLNDFAADLPPYWGTVRFDAATMQGALEYFRTHRPRVFYVMLGDTDEWAHERRYDLYLDAGWRADRFIRRLWETAQALEQYRGRTALLVTTDHGRGAAPADWTDHGRDVPAAERIWIAALGPDTPALGVRERAPVTQAQVAATVAALLGEDFRRAAPQAAPPLPEVVAPPNLRPPQPAMVYLSDAMEPQAVVRAMTVVADWQLAHPSQHQSFGWEVAPFWAGLFVLAPLSESPAKYLEAIRRNAESNQWKPGPRPLHADDHAITQSYFLLYTLEHDRHMIEPALTTFGEMLRAPFDESLEFSDEKTAREWVWCDALFMSPPALALATRVTGDRSYADLMDRLWWKTTDYLYDQKEHLYYRDSRFFHQREPNGRKVFWSRGNAWVLAGLVRVLQYLPEDYPARPRFRALFQEMAQRVAGLQGPDGYWRASLLDPASRPAPETSGTGFFTYALAWGVKQGLLDRATFEPAVRKGWEALVHAVQPTGMLGYVQHPGDRPGDTGPDDTEPYGAGAFLLAASEVHRLALHAAR